MSDLNISLYSCCFLRLAHSKVLVKCDFSDQYQSSVDFPFDQFQVT